MLFIICVRVKYYYIFECVNDQRTDTGFFFFFTYDNDGKENEEYSAGSVV